MLFFNGGSHPVFADVNGDGLQDTCSWEPMVSFKRRIKKISYDPFIKQRYWNCSFILRAEYEDYLSFSQYGEFTGRFAPTFGEMDDDGDEDLMVGDARGPLYLAINNAGKDKPMTFEPPVWFIYADISAGQNAKPQIIDLDDDGLKDLSI